MYRGKGAITGVPLSITGEKVLWCEGNHEYGQCGEGATPMCCNCGGAHSAAYKGCTIQPQAQEVQKYTYRPTAAMEMAVNQEERSGTEGYPTPNHRHLVRPTIRLVDKILAFLANIIHCSAQTESHLIKIIINAAKTHLEMAEVSIEEVKRILLKRRF